MLGCELTHDLSMIVFRCTLKFYSSILYTSTSCSEHILYTIFYTVCKVLTRRICLTIKNFFIFWSFPCSRDLDVWFRGDIVRRNQMLVTHRDQRVITENEREWIPCRDCRFPTFSSIMRKFKLLLTIVENF